MIPRSSILAAGALFLCIGGAAVVLAWPLKPLVLTGANDFLNFYAGGKLAFTGMLYNPDAVSAVQQQYAGVASERLPFTRLPFSAAALWPLARLPFTAAYIVWQLLNLAAAVALVAIWNPAGRRAILLALCASAPLYWSFANGQNLPVLLLCIALAVRLLAANHDAAAGLILALTLDKYHLFLLIPLCLIAMRRPRAAAGYFGGAAALLALSFAIAGPAWPHDYLDLLLKAPIHGRQNEAPNFFGLIRLLPGGTIWLSPLILLTAAGVLITARRSAAPLAIAAAILGSLLIAPHIYVQDLVLLVPAAVIALTHSTSEPVRLSALVLLTPFPYLLELTVPFPAGQVIPVAMIALLAGLASARPVESYPPHA